MPSADHGVPNERSTVEHERYVGLDLVPYNDNDSAVLGHLHAYTLFCVMPKIDARYVPHACIPAFLTMADYVDTCQTFSLLCRCLGI